ncbi:DUF1972 domain-containing protein [Roseivirga sp.]|uniref:DUF1972 domain-containing protein n=1 Tax=Roseivirga sp. TaxID=1964215 RepID=UPI003B8CEA22
MKTIAIVGSRGIPNNYSGFEQCAEYLSVHLVSLGHEVYVYNSTDHPYTENEYRGVKIVRKPLPLKMGPFANFIYDWVCLKDAIKKRVEVVIELGYGSSAPSIWFYKKAKPVVMTNMDGLEWKRTKWSPFMQKCFRWLEKLAANSSDILISDNHGITDYLQGKYPDKETFYLPYGADTDLEFTKEVLTEYQLAPFDYYMVIARLEPENNVQTVIEGYLKSKSQKPLLIVGNTNTKFGELLFEQYGDKVRFLGGIFDKSKLDSLRRYCLIYFHGHSVGGTNPSLLEAMACKANVVAHDNVFNKGVLLQKEGYFKDGDEVKGVIEYYTDATSLDDAKIKANFEEVKYTYNWKELAGNLSNRIEEL